MPVRAVPINKSNCVQSAFQLFRAPLCTSSLYLPLDPCASTLAPWPSALRPASLLSHSSCAPPVLLLCSSCAPWRPPSRFPQWDFPPRSSHASLRTAASQLRDMPSSRRNLPSQAGGVARTRLRVREVGGPEPGPAARAWSASWVAFRARGRMWEGEERCEGSALRLAHPASRLVSIRLVQRSFLAMFGTRAYLHSHLAPLSRSSRSSRFLPSSTTPMFSLGFAESFSLAATQGPDVILFVFVRRSNLSYLSYCCSSSVHCHPHHEPRREPQSREG